MPELTLTAAAPLIAVIPLGTVIRDVDVTVLEDGLIALVLSGVGAGASLVGPLDTVHGLILEANRTLNRLRGHREL